MLSLRSFASLLTLLLFLLIGQTGCALFSSRSSFDEEDPIERASLAERERYWRRSASLPRNFYRSDDEIQKAVQSGSIILGMGMREVISVWGKPRNVETAGDPALGNQRWIYTEQWAPGMSSNPTRVVYFEAGKVAGWENALRPSQNP